METGVFVCSHIFANTHPVLLVSRADGEWQFLCGAADHEARLPAVVGLNHLLERDPSINRVLDLPAYWEAGREGVGAPWRACPAASPGPGSLDWEAFFATAVKYLIDRQSRLSSDFKLDSWERYDYDQGAGTLTLSSQGKGGVTAEMHLVGSTAYHRGTWLWSWDNPSDSERVTRSMRTVREYGETHGFAKLTTALWPGDDSDGWDMTAVATYILQAEGAYRIPKEHGALFMVLQHVCRVEGLV
jgi:hypothetical protein